MDLPTGTVTFLFTDIEGSTDLWEQDEVAARQVLVRHDEIIEGLVEQHEGMLVRPRGEGDSRFAVFEMAPRSVGAAVDIQRAFAEEPWPTDEPLSIRIGLHTGNADLREGDYYGSAVNRCARVRSLGHGGQVLLSLATEQLSAEHMPEGVELRDLGQHSLKGLKRPEQIFQLVIPGAPSEFPPLETQTGAKHNLPEQVTPFVGREAEVLAVRKLFTEDGARLVTLKGPGGMGKTRLAIEVAGQEAESFADGARFVALAPLDSADQIVQAFLESLNLRPASQEDPRDFLLQHLRRSDLLIVVDNFEHVLEGSQLIADILEHSANVKLLATCRERLNLGGESVYDLAGLEFSDWQTAEQALLSSCAQLFVQGAVQVHPQFELEDAEVPHLLRICRLVDGTPLALLLSASWMDMITLEEIADEVEISLDFLETELRDAPARQKSVRAVFAASWDRLLEPERDLFMKLSVFRGGFVREAAAKVAKADLRSLARLADKSFIRRNPDTARYEIHELLRQYGEERLLANEQASQTTRQIHAAYFAELLAAKEKPLTSGIEVEPLDEIEADIDNIRRAWRYLAEAGDVQSLQKSLLSVWMFHEVRCWLHAGLELFTKTDRSLRESSEGNQTDLVSTQLQAIGAWFTILLGLPEQGVAIAKSTLDWFKEHGNRQESTYSLLVMAVGNQFLRSPSEAIAAAIELTDIGDEMGSKWWAMKGKTTALASSLLMGDPEGAERYLEENDQLMAETGGPWNSNFGLQAHARMAEMRGDLTKAKEVNLLLINSLRSVSFVRGMQYAYASLGRISLHLDELDEAEENYALSLRISWDTGQALEMLGNLTDMAKVWRAQGNGPEALEAIAAVIAHPESRRSSVLRGSSIREDAEALRSELESELDADHYEAAWKKGSDEEVDDIVVRILRELEA